jgi:hypothetical protein
MTADKRAQPAAELLQALGWVTVRWAQLEAYVDLICAYLSRHDGGAIVPKPFNARLKFVRRTLNKPTFLNLMAEVNRLQQAINILAKERNELVHSVVTRWSEPHGMQSHVLKLGESGYVVVQGIETTLDEIRTLIESMEKIGARLFGFLERLKSIIRLAQGNQDFLRIARMAGDRG